MNRILRAFRARSRSPVDPAHPVDVGLPLGAFKLCPRQSHVMEAWSPRCPGCVEEDEGLSQGAPPSQATPEAPPVPETPDHGGPKATAVLSGAASGPGGSSEVSLAFPLSPSLHRPSGARETVQLPAGPVARGGKGHTEVLRPRGGDTPPRRGGPWGRLVLEIELRGAECRLGCDPESDVPLVGDGLAGHHVTLSLSDGKPWLRLSTEAGVSALVNGRPVVGGQVLHHGDKLNLGSVRLRFERPDAEDESH